MNTKNEIRGPGNADEDASRTKKRSQMFDSTNRNLEPTDKKSLERTGTA